MNEAADNSSIEWRSAEAALEDWFESEFENLPRALQSLFQRGSIIVADTFVLFWNLSNPRQRRGIARQRDLSTHPALSDAHDAVWKAMAAVDRLKLVAKNKSEADRDFRDVIQQDEAIQTAVRRRQEADSKLSEMAARLGIIFDVSEQARIFFTEKFADTRLRTPERSGAPGRPTSMHLVALELERRSDAGETELTSTREAEVLALWLALNHPAAPKVRFKGIQNSLRPQLREAVRKQKNARNGRPK